MSRAEVFSSREPARTKSAAACRSLRRAARVCASTDFSTGIIFRLMSLPPHVAERTRFHAVASFGSSSRTLAGSPPAYRSRSHRGRVQSRLFPGAHFPDRALDMLDVRLVHPLKPEGLNQPYNALEARAHVYRQRIEFRLRLGIHKDKRP